MIGSFVAPQTALAALSSYNVPPNGRLTLTTVTPVLTTAVAAAATVFFTPYGGSLVPIWDGSRFVARVFTELSNVLANSAVGSAGPAAGAASKNYDLFVWSNSGTLTLTRGAAWNSDTVRSSTTENDLQLVQGLWTNLNAITNGPGVGLGTYVGTVRTDSGGATVSWSRGGSASGGTIATFHIFDAYRQNQVHFESAVVDSDVGGSYTSSTIRAYANSANMRCSYIRGLAEGEIRASFEVTVQHAAASGAACSIGLALDVTNSFSKSMNVSNNAAVVKVDSMTCNVTLVASLGFHFISAVQQSDNTNATLYSPTIARALLVVGMDC